MRSNVLVVFFILVMNQLYRGSMCRRAESLKLQFLFFGQKPDSREEYAYEQIRVEEMGARPCSTVRRQDYKSVHFFRGWVGVCGSRAPVTFVVLVVVALISRRSAHLGVFDGRYPAGSDDVGV